MSNSNLMRLYFITCETQKVGKKQRPKFGHLAGTVSLWLVQKI